jgi:hypothetical protein
MNSNFDLNINNYTIKELESIFELPHNYNISTIQLQENKLKQNIEKDNNIPFSIKSNTTSFISLVKNTLINNLNTSNNNNNNNNNGSTTILSDISNNLRKIQHLDLTLNSSQTVEAGNTSIIQKPPTPYVNGYGMEFFPGNINPLDKRILKKIVNIDTRFRENYYTTTSTNFQIDLPGTINQVVFLELAAIEFPASFYTISKVFGNNFFTLEIEGSEPLVVTIPDGNYDYLSLQNYVNNYLTSSGSPYSNIQISADIENTSSSLQLVGGSQRMIFGSINGSTSFSINFLTDKYGVEDRATPLPLKLGWLLGFREGYYENAFTYVSEGLVNLLGPRYFYLVVDDYNNNVSDGFYSAFNSSILNKNILARISVNGASLYSTNINISQFAGNLVVAPRHYFGPVNVSKLKIQMLDEYGRILDLNNMDYSIVLSYLVVYDL